MKCVLVVMGCRCSLKKRLAVSVSCSCQLVVARSPALVPATSSTAVAPHLTRCNRRLLLVLWADYTTAPPLVHSTNSDPLCRSDRALPLKYCRSKNARRRHGARLLRRCWGAAARPGDRVFRLAIGIHDGHHVARPQDAGSDVGSRAGGDNLPTIVDGEVGGRLHSDDAHRRA